jgi:hypothetical protein
VTPNPAPSSPAEWPRFETSRDEPKPPAVAGRAEPSDAELERGIVDAVRAGLAGVARVLAAQLEARQRTRLPNNVESIERARLRAAR